MGLSESSNRWSYRQGTGWLALFGLPFFLAGCTFFYAGLTADEINGGPPTIGLRVFFCAFSSIFIFIGLALIAGFKKVTLDKSQRKIIHVQGVVFPLKYKQETYTEISNIEVSKEVRVARTKNGTRTYTVYPIRLKSSKSIDICEVRDSLQSRNLAESLAKFLNCGILDRSSGAEVERKNQDLDLSVFDRLKQDKTEIKNPKLPESLKNKVQNDYSEPGGKLIIDFGCPSDQEPKVLWIVSGLCILCLLVCIYNINIPEWEEGSEYYFKIFFHNLKFLTIAPIFGFVFFLKFILRGLLKTKIILSPSMLSITESILGIPYNTHFKREEIEELNLKHKSSKFKTGSLLIRTDHKEKLFVNFHPYGQVEYLRDLIQFEMSRN